jgi:hypothetical protein
MKRGRVSTKRKAVAGIVAAVLLFAMLFTVGASYFLFVNSENQAYVQSLIPRVNNFDSQGMESLLVNTELLSSNNHVGFYVNNTGGVNANITTFIVYSSTATPLECVGKGLPASSCTAQSSKFTICSNASCSTDSSPSPSFVVVNVGKGTSVIDTGYTYSSTTVTIKVITARGETFAATYPVTSTSSSVGYAQDAGAFGDLYLTFSDYKSWTLTTTGCSTTGDFSGYCLSSVSSAYTVAANLKCYSTTYCDVFSVRVTDLNPNKKSIQLSQDSIFYQIYTSGANSKAGYLPWYIITNSSSNIYKHFHIINLTYNTPQTLVFGASGCLVANSGPNLSTCTTTVSGTGWLVQQGSNCGTSEPCGQVGISFINPIGWELSSLSATKSLSYSSLNYGQDIPFLSTLYS